MSLEEMDMETIQVNLEEMLEQVEGLRERATELPMVPLSGDFPESVAVEVAEAARYLNEAHCRLQDAFESLKQAEGRDRLREINADLLAALKECSDEADHILGTEVDHFGFKGVARRNAKAIKATAKAAIAKAEGKA